MKKAFFAVVIVFAIYCGYRYYSNPALSGSVHCPATIAWRQVFDSKKGTDVHNTVLVYAMDGARWRVEGLAKNGKSFVALFDGQKYSASDPRLTDGKLSPLKEFEAIYAALPRSFFYGTEVLEGRKCWRFFGRKNGYSISVWIDSETKFPARVSLSKPDGSLTVSNYYVLPIDIAGNSGHIFDAGNTAPLFVSYMQNLQSPGQPAAVPRSIPQIQTAATPAWKNPLDQSAH